jgi:radical SAM superfamily enzyme YgiQ (UPF0313 family)
MANLGELRSRAELVEFDIHCRPADVAEAILSREPRIAGIGVYIWNVTQCTELVAKLKQRQPGLIIVLGGPEVSYEVEQQEICRQADCVITGEGEAAFAEFCRQPGAWPHVVRPAQPDLSVLAMPYDLYTDEDLAHRVTYVEASRGCPFGCEFCLSSLDETVRYFPLDPFLAAMQRLLDRGARRFKFVDRSFNANLPVAQRILQFFLDRLRPDLNVHFEMIPDRFPDALRALIRQFPAGALRLEVGIQSFNDEVNRRIRRRQDNAKAEANLRWLREETNALIHADLVLGLPGESLESIAAGFDRLVALGPHEIQVGILKRLRGAPIKRHDEEWLMVYGAAPPYEVLQTKLIDAHTMQRLRRFARYWELIYNRGKFAQTAPLIWRGGSPFWEFLPFSDWLYEHTGQTHGIALDRLRQLLAGYLTARG